MTHISNIFTVKYLPSFLCFRSSRRGHRMWAEILQWDPAHLPTRGAAPLRAERDVSGARPRSQRLLHPRHVLRRLPTEYAWGCVLGRQVNTCSAQATNRVCVGMRAQETGKYMFCSGYRVCVGMRARETGKYMFCAGYKQRMRGDACSGDR